MLKKALEVNQENVAITTDLWTSSNQKNGYMTVTAHFVDNDWILQNCTLRYNYNLFHVYLCAFVYLFGEPLMLECSVTRMLPLMLIYIFLYV